MSLVLRVKRKKLTVFVTAEPSDTVLEVKHKLHEMLGQAPEATPDAQRLYHDSELLEDSNTLADLKLDNDSVLGLAYRQQGSGDWEPVDITPLDEAKEGGRAYYE